MTLRGAWCRGLLTILAAVVVAAQEAVVDGLTAQELIAIGGAAVVAARAWLDQSLGDAVRNGGGEP